MAVAEIDHVLWYANGVKNGHFSSKMGEKSKTVMTRIQNWAITVHKNGQNLRQN